MNNKKDAVKVLSLAAGVLFVSVFVIVKLLPKGVALIFAEYGFPISSENLVIKYSMGIGIRAIGFILFFMIMKKAHMTELYHYKLDKNDLKLSWMFILYIILNIEIVPIENLNLLPVLLMITESLMIGLYEETIFRGLVLQIFLKKWGNSKQQIIFSVLTSSIMFGLIHLLNLSLNQNTATVITQVCYATIMGIAFSALLLRTNGNLILCSFLHGFYDMASGFGDFAEKASSGTQAVSMPENIFPYILNVINFIPLLVYGLFLLRKAEPASKRVKL